MSTFYSMFPFPFRTGDYKVDVPDEKHEFIEQDKLISSVLDESLSNLIACYLESYVKSHSEAIKTIERLQARARTRKGR